MDPNTRLASADRDELLSLVADFYWQSDLDHRITGLTCLRPGPAETAAMALRGLRLDRIAVRCADGDGNRDLLDALDAQGTFHDIEVELADATGAVVRATLSGTARRGPGDRFAGFRGVGQVRGRQRADRRHRLEAAAILAEAEAGRERERRLRMEADALLTSMALLIKPIAMEAKWNQLFDIFAEVIGFETAAVVRRGVGGALRSWVSQPRDYEGMEWPESELLGDVMLGRSHRLDLLIERSDVLPPALAARSFSAVLAPLQLGKETAILALCSSRHDAFGDQDTELLRRLGLIAAQAFQADEQKVALMNASKLSSLGEMMATIAHEVNSPLSVIAMAAHNALPMIDSGADPARLRGKLEKIGRQATRASEIVHAVRVMAHPDRSPTATQPVSLADVMQHVAMLMSAPLRNRLIDLRIAVPAGCRDAAAHPSNLHQVLINLIVNARDAIEARMRGDQASPEHAIAIDVVDDPAEAEILLRVSDTGGGVPPDVMDRIFDPFFTLKPASQGTGLGLSIVRAMLADMKAGIAVRNGPAGAVFEIRLPAHVALP